MELFLPEVMDIIDDEEHRAVVNLRRQLRDASNPFSLSEPLFRQYFRLSKTTVQFIIEDLTSELYRDSSQCNAISPEVKIFTALQFYGHGTYQKIVGQDLFMPMSQSSVSRCITEVTQAILKVFANKINFPTTSDEINKNKLLFLNKTGFPGVVGCVDGTHISIIAPPTNNTHAPSLLFYNRKGYYSLNVQIVCDATYKILNVNTMYPGSVHDSAVWQSSGVRRILKQRYENGDHSSWLIGDQGYPLEPWLLTPDPAAEPDSPESRYNTLFRKTRIMVEQTIGYLKSVFRCLHKHRALHYSPLAAGKIVGACSILHNLRVECNDLSPDDLTGLDDEADAAPEPTLGRQEVTQLGRITRQNLIRNRFT